MLYDYSKAYSPPAPVIDVVISNPLTGKEVTCKGIIDPGAQMTVIPKKILELLNPIEVVSRVNIQSFDGCISATNIYSINLCIAKIVIKGISVICYEENTALLGRDILNQFVITLDGKRGILEIKEDEK
ncbi:MAG: hypothetical protein AB1397_04145 [bacterium]